MDLEKFYLDISDRCFSLGLEEFEEKMDTIGESGEKESSWLGSILQGVLSEADLDEEEEEEEEREVESEKTKEEEDVDYVEPPFLDTRLGGLESSQALIRRRRSATTHARQGKQKKTQDKIFEGEEERSCTVELWRCLAHAFEPTVRQAEKDGSITR